MRNERENRNPGFPGWILCVVAAAWIAAGGCGGGGKSPQTEVDDQPWEVRLESPLDTVVVENGPGEEGAPAGGSVPAARTPVAETAPDTLGSEATEVPDPRDFTPGWRVQIYASHSLQVADGKAKEFEASFHEPVYLEYEPPFYKVRVGNFLVKGDAEAYRDRISTRGWNGAWVTETLVLKPGS